MGCKLHPKAGEVRHIYYHVMICTAPTAVQISCGARYFELTQEDIGALPVEIQQKIALAFATSDRKARFLCLEGVEITCIYCNKPHRISGFSLCNKRIEGAEDSGE